jgi:hypothetical protein
VPAFPYAAGLFPYAAGVPFTYNTAAVASPAPAVTYKTAVAPYASVAPYTTAYAAAPMNYANYAAPYVHAPVVSKAASYYANSGGAVHIVKRDAEAAPYGPYYNPYGNPYRNYNSYSCNAYGICTYG